jgi:pimeloyl-ACP methyl ester carboxylesterase
MSQLQSSQIVVDDTVYPAGHVQSIPSEPIALVLGGYSYGSLIVTLLPPTPEMLAIFRKPSKWVPEILLRARELALQTNRSLRGRGPDDPPARRQHKRQSSSQHSIIYGGNDEPSPADRHIDPKHKAVEIQTRIKHAIHRNHKSASSTTSAPPSEKPDEITESMPAIPHVSTHYLLISPLLPPLSNFLSLSTPSLFFWRHHDHNPQTLLHHPTLVIFGTKDVFTSSTKLDAWCQKMNTLSIKNNGVSSFRWRKVEGAGHFWREQSVEAKLRLSVREWVEGVVVQGE